MIELKAPIIVDFEITNRCPYRCIFCEADIPNIKSINEMSTKHCLYVLEKLAKAEVFDVFLTGGEPLMRDDLPKLIKHCFNIGLEPCISTNAFYLDEERLEKIVNAGLDHIQISIQGPELIHESIVKKPGSYSRVMKNLEKAIEIGCRVEVTCVGLKENFKYIPILLKEVASVGVRKFRVLRYVPSHRKDMLKHIPPREIVMKYIPIIKETAKKHNIDLLLGTPPGLYPSSYSSVDMIYEGVHPTIYTCPAGKTEFDILPNGDVYPCMSFKNKPEMYCGNILEKSVYELWNSKPMRMLRQLTPADYTGICGQCKRKWTCYSCRCVAYNLTGDLYGDDLTCYIVREKLGLIETEEDSLEALDFHCKCE